MNKIMKKILLPVISLKKRYIPLLLIYFAYGFAGFAGIAESFWIKNELDITPEQLISIGIWATMPWTLKIIIGQFIDNISIKNSKRKSYIIIGGIIMSVGMVVMYLMSIGATAIFLGLSVYQIYVLSAVLTALGFVIQDVVADTMCEEVVEKNNKTEEEIKKELTVVQILARLSITIAGLFAACISGYAATYIPFSTLCLLKIVVPFIGIISCLFLPSEHVSKNDKDGKMFFAAVVYFFFCMFFGTIGIPYTQEIVFTVSLGIVIWLLCYLCKDMSAQSKKTLLLVGVGMFLFRSAPGIGPAISWWQIDYLGFDEMFFANLNQIGMILALAGTWLLSSYMLKVNVARIMLILGFVYLSLRIPSLLMFYDFHIWTEQVFGFGAKTIAVIDEAIGSPFAQLSMIPLGAIAAYYAPSNNKSTWFALTASLMNLSLQMDSIITKYINRIFPIEKGQYDNLDNIIILSTLICLAFYLLSYVFLKRSKFQ